MDQDKGCLCCAADEETLERIFQCKDKQMSKVRNENLEVVTKTLKGIKCPDKVIRPFVEALRCLCGGKEIKITEKNRDDINCSD